MVLDNLTIAAHLLQRLKQSEMAASNDPSDLAEALIVTIRVAHLLGHVHLQKGEQAMPSSVQSLMELPPPEIDTERDAFAVPDDYLSFVDILDLMSEENMDCVAPHLHRGWQDKKESCRNARRAARATIGFSIGFRFRDELLAAAAIYNRISLVPATVALESAAVRGAFESVLRFVEALVPVENKEAFSPIIETLQT